MVLVVVFLVAFVGYWGQASREIAQMIRIEEARSARVSQDAARLPAQAALSQALAALEVGYPPSNSYQCVVVLSADQRFSVTYNFDATTSNQWVVAVEPTTDNTLPPLDPTQFQTTAP